nr:hypothetical protein RTCK_02031 [Rhizobium sp. TCK]
MTNHMQADLFGHTAPQGELFSDGPSQPGWTPDPDKVRRRLERILTEVRSATSMPWDWSQQSLYEAIFPQMAELLPKDEAEQYCLTFEQELDRLKAA